MSSPVINALMDILKITLMDVHNVPVIVQHVLSILQAILLAVNVVPNSLSMLPRQNVHNALVFVKPAHIILKEHLLAIHALTDMH